MKYNLQYVPFVNTACSILSSRFSNRDNVLVVDHLTVHEVDPEDWEIVFVVCAETTFKIRSSLDRLGEKLVLIHTSHEPGLDKYMKFYFPHWLFCIIDANAPSNLSYNYSGQSDYLYNAMLGRAKDPRTKLLQCLSNNDLIEDGIISYHPGNHYGPDLTLDPTPYYNNIWEYEQKEIKEVYNNDFDYVVKLDSTTRLPNGHFSSCNIPWKIYNNTSISVVAETDNYGSHVFTTEKTWKPLLAMHPVLYYGTPRHEEFLENLGFEMYIKTNSDSVRIASVLKDIANGGWKDFGYQYWHDIADHNRNLCDIKIWHNRLHQWLCENFVS